MNARKIFVAAALFCVFRLAPADAGTIEEKYIENHSIEGWTLERFFDSKSKTKFEIEKEFTQIVDSFVTPSVKCYEKLAEDTAVAIRENSPDKTPELIKAFNNKKDEIIKNVSDTFEKRYIIPFNKARTAELTTYQVTESREGRVSALLFEGPKSGPPVTDEVTVVFSVDKTQEIIARKLFTKTREYGDSGRIEEPRIVEKDNKITVLVKVHSQKELDFRSEITWRFKDDAIQESVVKEIKEFILLREEVIDKKLKQEIDNIPIPFKRYLTKEPK